MQKNAHDYDEDKDKDKDMNYFQTLGYGYNNQGGPKALRSSKY